MSSTAREAARPRLRITPRAVILGLIVVALLFYLLVPLRSYMAQRSSLDRLANQVTQLETQNSRLQAQVRRLNDPRFLEERARECLGMVRPGEISFIVVPKGGSPAPPAC